MTHSEQEGRDRMAHPQADEVRAMQARLRQGFIQDRRAERERVQRGWEQIPDGP